MSGSKEPSASSLVYLFGDRFAGRASPLSPSERLPCGDARVQRRELAQAMLRAAFASLEGEGCIGLSLGQKKTLIFTSGAVFVSLKRRGAHHPCSLEARILESITGDHAKDGVEQVVGRAIGEESVDPWATVIGVAKDELLATGYLEEGERSGLAKLVGGRTLTPICDRIAALRGRVPATQTLLLGLDRDPALRKRLAEDIKRGITSMAQTRDVDADG